MCEKQFEPFLPKLVPLAVQLLDYDGPYLVQDEEDNQLQGDYILGFNRLKNLQSINNN